MLVVAVSLLIGSSAAFYHFVIYLPGRDARLDASHRAVEHSRQVELCRKIAQEQFDRDPGKTVTNTEDGQDFNGFINHYNDELGTCFSMTIITSLHSKASKPYSSESIGLIDVREGKIVTAHLGYAI